MPVDDELPRTVDEPVKRSDVRYRCPPREHRFTTDNQPSRRKKKEVPAEMSIIEIFGKILNEERRMELGGKVRWLTRADLVIKRAWQEAERGSAMLRRDLFKLLLNSEPSAPEQGFLIVTDPDAPASSTHLGLRIIDDGKT